MTSLRDLLGAARAQLPRAGLACWAATFFSLSVLTFPISLAAAQALLALAGVLAAAHFLREPRAARFPPVKLPLLLFCAATVISVLFAANPGIGWFAVRKLVLFVILLLAVSLLVRPRHLEWLFKGLFVVASVAGLLAIAQFAVQYRAVLAAHPGRLYDYLMGQRVTGFMGDWMNFGGQQMLVFAALAAFLLWRTRRAAQRPPGVAKERAPWGWLLALAVVAASILVNFTRGVWLGCAVGTIYLLWRWRRRWLWALPVLALAGYLFAPRMVRERVYLAFHPYQDPALSIRLQMWQVGLRMMERHPWWGVGPNNILESYNLYLPRGAMPGKGYHGHLHDNFIQFGAERGLPALAAWIWLMAALGWHFWRIRRRLAASAQVWIADAAFAGWLALLTEGCFEFNFGTSPVLMMFLFVASTPFVAERCAASAAE
jgi:O-antigen ligase